MKNLLALFCFFCLLATTQLSAQHFGLRAGVNSTSAKIDVSGIDIDTDGQTNLMLGLFFNVPIGTNLISIQPEINYLNRGYSFDLNIGNNSFEQTFAFIDLGALVRLNFGTDDGLGFYVGAGPYLSYVVSGKVTDINGERDVDFDSDPIKRSGLQFAGVGGLTFGRNLKFFVEARYMGSISNLSDEEESNVKQNSIGINGGVMIPLGN